MSGRLKMNQHAKRTGAQAAQESGLVTGHDFSRAASDAQSTRALAPEGGSSAATATPATMTLVQIRQQLKGTKGMRYWRSVDELANTPEFQAAVEKEFPGSPHGWGDEVSRRGFLKFMGASAALAGLAG